jgi:hypothetical protein
MVSADDGDGKRKGMKKKKKKIDFALYQTKSQTRTIIQLQATKLARILVRCANFHQAC